jgi:hypothetical protein
MVQKHPYWGAALHGFGESDILTAVGETSPNGLRGKGSRGSNRRWAAQRPREQIFGKALQEFVRPSLFWGAALALADLAQYVAAIAGVLWLTPLWAKTAGSVFAGLKIANLATLGCDAAHGTLTPSARLNRILGVIVFLPGFTNWGAAPATNERGLRSGSRGGFGGDLIGSDAWIFKTVTWS